MNFKTEQEEFWAGDFGTEYINRNNSAQMLASNLAFFSEVFKHTGSIASIIEFGSNIGMNIRAIRQLLPNANLSAIEINKNAAEKLKEISNLTVYNHSILDFVPDEQRDFVFTKGVLIHINPDFLPKVYEALYNTSNNFILVAEYYNPTPMEINYRGHTNKLFKRDFAGDLLKKYSDLKLVSYGFVYRYDNLFPQDDCTWFLLKKVKG